MKRSEIIKLICSHIDNNVSYYYKNGCNFYEYDADDLLRVLEKAGMLPPENKDKSYKLSDNGEMIYSVNEWEPEDEKETTKTKN